MGGVTEEKLRGFWFLRFFPLIFATFFVIFLKLDLMCMFDCSYF